MVVAYGIIQLRIPESASLKEKRSVLNRILKRSQNEFNVSIAQVGDLDHRHFAQIAFALVGNESRYVNSKVDHLLNFIEDLNVAEMMDSKVEIMAVSDFPKTASWEKGKYGEL